MTEMDEDVQGEAPSTQDLDKLTKVYIKIRDARDQLESDHKKRIAELEEQLSIIETEMLDACKNMNADSVRTPHGTIIRTVKAPYE
jgi:hypothetical protein